MPPNYTVRARVVDIRRDTPRDTDRFLVDTNVWFWQGYRGATTAYSGSPPPQMAVYLAYLAQTVVAGSRRCCAGLTLAELAHAIEEEERNQYASAVAPVTTKEYRHNLPTEHTRVAGEITIAWGKITSLSEPLALTIDPPTTNHALSRFAAEPVDGYDLFLLEAMTAAGVTQLLSDDGDFCAVAGIDVFTANPRVLAAARTKGQLVVR